MAEQDRKPSILGGLLGLTLLALVVVGVRWLWGGGERLHRDVPTLCLHWVALDGAFVVPRLLCLKGTLQEKRRHWRRAYFAAKPRCHLRKKTPKPLKGIRSPMLFSHAVDAPAMPIHARGLWLGVDKEGGCLEEVRPFSAKRRVFLGLALELNQAKADDLVWIPGISKRIANRIVGYRDKQGSFRSVEELVRVSGVGWKTLQRIRPFLKLTIRSNISKKSTILKPSEKP